MTASAPATPALAALSKPLLETEDCHLNELLELLLASTDWNEIAPGIARPHMPSRVRTLAAHVKELRKDQR